ncbi:MAG: hypothetical protein WCO06_05985 [Candidatus Roizmanbacteria bacterium]
MKEFEVRVLNINVEEVEEKLRSIGAKKEYEYHLKELVYKRDDWQPVRGRVRIRSQGSKLYMAYKETLNNTTIGGAELEFEISSLEAGKAFVEKMGAHLEREQEKKRIHYSLDCYVFDIDSWPRINPMLEIEAPDKERIPYIITKLGYLPTDVVEEDIFQVYKKYYNIDLTHESRLMFD